MTRPGLRRARRRHHGPQLECRCSIASMTPSALMPSLSFRLYAAHIDTYSVIGNGLPDTIRVAKEVLEPMGHRLKGVRIDSGDIAYVSKRIREKLDEAGLTDCKIVVSNSMDEFLIRDLILQGACIDTFGIGERLITSRSSPIFGGCTSWPPSSRMARSSPRSRSAKMWKRSPRPISSKCGVSTTMRPAWPAQMWSPCTMSPSPG